MLKTARYSDAQIMGILKQAEGGVPVSELCREHGMSSASFYKWRAKFGGMDASLIADMKDMAAQNRRLKKMLSIMFSPFGPVPRVPPSGKIVGGPTITSPKSASAPSTPPSPDL